MISTDFAPNEFWDDAWLSFKLLFQPWRWMEGKELNIAKEKISKEIFDIKNNQLKTSLFLSGRFALYHLLKSLNLKKGDEVLIQGFTCEAVILPILALKLKPIYVDIENQSFSMNPIDLKKKLSKRSKVLILQHTFGITPIYRETIISFSKKYNLVLIEDIAHTIKKIKMNNQKLKINNHFFLLSFGRSKSVSSVFGGAVIGNNKKIMEKLSKLSIDKPSYSFIIKCLLYKPIVIIIKLTYNIYWGKIIHRLANFFNLLTPEVSKKEKEGFIDFYLNKSYPNGLAILLINQLKKLKKTNQNRLKIVNFYIKNFIDDKKFKLYLNQPLIRLPLLVNNRQKILKKLAKKGIFLGKWYDQPIAPKDLPLNRVEYKINSCPKAEKICQQIINLPTNIKIKEAEFIIRNLKKQYILNDVF